MLNWRVRQLPAVLGAAVLLCTVNAALAQPMMPSGGPGGPKSLAPDKVIQTVGVDQKLDAQISPDLTFKNEKGETVRLGDYFGKRPIVLSLVYYKCPGLCTMTLNGVSTSLRPLTFTPGKEYDVLTVSFDPRDTAALAAEKKERYVKDFLRPGITAKHDPASVEAGWHFLTGDEANIAELCKTVGFRYSFDARTQQYAHASAIMVLTPSGKVSRYFYGLEYSTKDIRLGVIEAADEKIGTVTDSVSLFCYAYDPASGKYSLAVTRVLKVAALLTMLSLGSFVGLMLYRERRANRLAAAAPTPTPTPTDTTTTTVTEATDKQDTTTR